MKQTLGEMFRFGVVGAAATVVHAGMVVFLVEVLGLEPVWANVLAFLTALPVSYLGNFHWTFAAEGHHGRRLPRFVFTQAFGFTSSQTIMFVVVEVLRLHYGIALAIVVTTVPLMSYILSRKWVFSAAAPGKPADL
ncbi:MAG: GtrA family protein [Kiloniellales bacterium]|nr:GtrA family protein [Kiloniellales bacterium]